MLLENRIPFGYLARKARREALQVLAIASAVAALEWLVPSAIPSVPIPIPAFLGTAISLVLAFKLSQSYDRWWEARKVWGAIVNDSRTLARQLLTFAGDDDPRVRRSVRRQIAWCHALGRSLRGLDWKGGTEGYLSEAEEKEVDAHANRPLALLQAHARDVAALAADGRLTDYQRVAIDETLRRLTDWQGMSERIRGTVFPTTYRIFLHAFIYLFITLLSVALEEVQGPWQVAITLLIALPFLLLEKTARHMQDPFANRPTDTAVTAIARTIEVNLLQLLGQREVPPPAPANDYYLM